MLVIEKIEAIALSDADLFKNMHRAFVRETSLQLAQKIGGDEEVLALASLLHDVHQPDNPDQHTAYSAEFAQKTLSELHYPLYKQDKVVEAIYYCNPALSSRISSPGLESRIVFDADRMWGVTPQGITRTIVSRSKQGYSPLQIVQRLQSKFQTYTALYFDYSKKMILPELKISRKFVQKLQEACS